MRAIERVIRLIVSLAVIGALWLPLPAQAQEIIIEPPRPPIAWIEGVTVDEQRIDVTIEGPIAHVKVSQVFQNRSGRVAEGTYLFPLPADAAVGDFVMKVDGQVLEGVLMPQEQARRAYEAIVRQLRDPALLEYAGRGLFQTSVFPIPPGETRTVELTYSQAVDSADGLYRFTYPLRAAGAREPAERTMLHVELTSEKGLRVVYSPSHDVAIRRTNANLVTVDYTTDAGGEARGQAPIFTLYYGETDQSVGVNLLSYKPAGEDGYFMLLVAPTVEVVETDVVRRDVVFVLDVSGSMEGAKLGQAKDAIAYVVEHLNPGDRFNLIAFSTGVRLWSEALQEATPETMTDALAWIDDLAASGSTDINRALLEALAQFQIQPAEDAGAGYVLFMTDGLPTQGETNASKIVQNAVSNRPPLRTLRLFTFGVGYDVNTDLLDAVSRQLGGRSSYVRPDEAIDEAVSSFYNTIQTPVLTSVSLAFDEGVAPSELYPHPLPDLFAGEQLVVTGRYRSGAETAVVLAGEVNGVQTRTVYAGQKLVQAGGEPFVARLWATRKVGVLLDEIRRSGPNPELIDAIVDLSLQYGIVTPYTAYLVEEPATALQDGGVRGATEMPAPRAMEPLARDSVMLGAAEAAAAPASGEEAVAASQGRAKMQSATVVAENAEVRYAGGRAFVRQGETTLPDGRTAELWVDTAYTEEMRLEQVAFASERYFELAAQPGMAAMLAVSSEMVIVTGENTAIRITSAEEPMPYPAPVSEASSLDEATEEAPITPQVEPGEGRHGQSAWDDFLRWLFGD